VIALVENGDMVVVDLAKSTVEVEISNDEINDRRKRWVRPEPKTTKGILALYAATCKPADEGGAMQTW